MTENKLEEFDFDILGNIKNMMYDVKKTYKDEPLLEKVRILKDIYPRLYNEYMQVFRAVVRSEIVLKDLPVVESMISMRSKIVQDKMDLKTVDDNMTMFFYEKYKK